MSLPENKDDNSVEAVDEQLTENPNIKRARQNNIHIDVAVSPFLSDAEREKILQGELQDPEWD